MRLGTVVDYDGRRKYIGKRILKMQSETAKRLLGNPAIVYDFKREDGHVVSVAKNIFDRLEAAQPALAHRRKARVGSGKSKSVGALRG